LSGERSCGCIRKFKGFNKYKIDGDTTIIYFENRLGEIILEGYIDTEDLPKLIELNLSWSAAWQKQINDYYAKSIEYYTDENGKRKGKVRYLHRVVMNVTKETDWVDHREQNPEKHSSLDNRKANLRVTDCEHNSKKKKGKNKNNKSGYRNVLLDKDSGKYIIKLCINYKRFQVGKLYEDVHEAGRDAEMYRKQYYGEFAGKG